MTVDGHIGIAGSCFVYPADVQHRPTTTGETTLICLQWTGGEPPPAAVPPLPDRGGRLYGCLLWLLEWWPGLHAQPELLASNAERCQDLLRVLLHGLREAARPTAPCLADKVAAAREYLLRHLDGDHRMAELATLVGLSSAHLSRRFAAEYGVPPMRFLHQVRLERARAMLLGTTSPVSEIAAAVGFPDHSWFTESFHRHFGCTPQSVRKAPAISSAQDEKESWDSH